MSIGSAKLRLLILTLILALTALTPSGVAGGLECVGSSGYVSVYRVSEGIYYVVVDESFFKRLEGFLVKNYSGEDEWLAVKCSSAPWRLVLLEEAGFRAERCDDVGVTSVLGPREEARLSGTIETLLKRAGVSYSWAALKKHPETGLIMQVSYTPRGEALKALDLVGKARRVAEEDAGIKVDAVVVVETLWPPTSSRGEAEEPLKRLLKAVEEPWRVWKESGGVSGGPAAAIRSIGVDPLLYITVGVEAPRMEKLGASLGDLLSWLRSTVGPGVTPVVEIYEYEVGVRPDPGDTASSVPGAVAVAVIAAAVASAIIMFLKAKSFIVRRGYGFNVRG